MALTFGIANASVATRTATDTYDTPVDIPYVQLMGVTMRTISAEATGDDRIVGVASRVIAGQCQVRMQGVSLEALEVITGLSLITTGTAGTLVETLSIPGGHRLPGFGIVGQGLDEESTGDELIFVPFAKVTSDITLGTMEYGAFQTVEFTAMAIDDATYGILNLIERATTGTYTIPPAGITAP